MATVAALRRNYAAGMQAAAIGGAVEVLFWIDEEGRVAKQEIASTSGRPALDEAALRVAEIMQFTPAFQADRPVAVIVLLPVVLKAC